MRRYRNARYAPESLERKLSPSTILISPTSALVSAMPATNLAPATSANSYSSGDYLVDDDDGDIPPAPGDGDGPILTPDDPTGPVVPA